MPPYKDFTTTPTSFSGQMYNEQKQCYENMVDCYENPVLPSGVCLECFQSEDYYILLCSIDRETYFPPREDVHKFCIFNNIGQMIIPYIFDDIMPYYSEFFFNFKGLKFSIPKSDLNIEKMIHHLEKEEPHTDLPHVNDMPF